MTGDVAQGRVLFEGFIRLSHQVNFMGSRVGRPGGPVFAVEGGPAIHRAHPVLRQTFREVDNRSTPLHANACC